MDYRQVQRVAKDTISYIQDELHPGMNLREVRELCERKMFDLGVDSFWYYNIGAFVFAGNETAVSVSGREYVTSNRMIHENDIVTIDLSPQYGDIWGDYARTIILENGIVVPSVDKISNTEWQDGLRMEERLHEELHHFAAPDTTFEQLYHHMNMFISMHGFVNLDFGGNLGHSIVKRKDDRVYIEKGNTRRLGDVDFFTFEPHIGRTASTYGYKMENIYSFSEGKLTEF